MDVRAVALLAPKNPGAYCMRGWMDPRAILGFLEKKILLPAAGI